MAIGAQCQGVARRPSQQSAPIAPISPETRSGTDVATRPRPNGRSPPRTVRARSGGDLPPERARRCGVQWDSTAQRAIGSEWAARRRWPSRQRESGVDGAPQVMACIDFSQGGVDSVNPRMEETIPVLRERLVHCEHCGMTRMRGALSFLVGAGFHSIGDLATGSALRR